jgi:hypothetical protein
MSDDTLNFDDFFTDDTPATETPTPDYAELQTQMASIQQRAEAAEALARKSNEWNDRLSNALGGQPKQVDPYAQLANDPTGFVTSTVDPRLQQMQQELESLKQYQASQTRQQLETQYSQAFPELVPFKDEVIQHAASIYQTETAKGNYPTDNWCIEQAANKFRDKLKTYQGGQQQSQSDQFLRANALQLNTGSAPQATGLASALDQVGNDPRKFAALRAAVLKRGGKL